MTEKKYITGVEVLSAICEGHTVVPVNRTGYRQPVRWADNAVRCANGAVFMGDFYGNWEIVEEPATDAELIAEMRISAINTQGTRPDAANAYRACADMLEKRTVKL